jgi:phage gp36-like protein
VQLSKRSLAIPLVVSLTGYRPPPRHPPTVDPWTQARIEESAADAGPWTSLGTQNLSPVDTDPENPRSRNFTVENATLAQGWYRVVFLDASGDTATSDPVFSGAPTTLYTSIADLRDALAPRGKQDDATAANLSNAELADAITEAQQQIDAQLAQRYTVPFVQGSIPPLIAQLTRDLAAHSATLVHRRNHPLVENHPVLLRYRRAAELLAKLAKGEAEIPAVSSAVEQPNAYNAYDGSLFELDNFGIGVTVAPRAQTRSPYW